MPGGMGTEEGAVYMVAAPLAVLAGLKEPQEFTGVQLHFTPAVSPVTVAVTLAVAEVRITAGGACEIVTVIRGRLTVMVAGADFAVSVTDVAVTVTFPPEGTEAGAV